MEKSNNYLMEKSNNYVDYIDTISTRVFYIIMIKSDVWTDARHLFHLQCNQQVAAVVYCVWKALTDIVAITNRHGVAL